MSRQEFDQAVRGAAKSRAALKEAPAGMSGTYTNDYRFPGLGPDSAEYARARMTMRYYYGEGFTVQNGMLRHADARWRPPHQSSLYAGEDPVDHIRRLDRLFDSSRLTHDVVAYRGLGTGRSVFGDPASWPADLTGFKFVDPAYASTTVRREVATSFAQDGGVQARLILPRGTKAIQISDFGEEAELLLPRGTTFRVVHDRGFSVVIKDGKQIRIRNIDVEVIVPDRTPPLPWEGSADAATTRTATRVARAPKAAVKAPPKVTTEELAAQQGVSKAELSEIRRLMRTTERPPILIQTDEIRYARLAKTHADDLKVKAFAEQHLAIYNRLAQERSIADYWSQTVAPSWRLKAEGVTRAQRQAEAVQKFSEVIKDKPIIIRRAREDRLRQALEDGRLKTQFETGTSSGVLSTDMRAKFEQMTWGYARDMAPAGRPIYGYIGTRGVVRAGVDDQAVAMYGDIQLVLRDSVKRRTTVSAADSLDRRREIRPSPLDAIDYRSTIGHDMDYASDRYYDYYYAEAQIHGGVTWDDVAEVVFARQPEPATIAALARRGVRWRVLS
jgi:hypothetical protein